MVFTLDVFGRPNVVRVVEADPAGLMENTAIRRVQASRFRPRIVDGSTVVSAGRLVWSFQYDPAQIQSLSASR